LESLVEPQLKDMIVYKMYTGTI